MYAYVHYTFYHDCNTLTNQIAQKEVDKSTLQVINFINLQVFYQLASAARVRMRQLSGRINWVPGQQFFHRLRS